MNQLIETLAWLIGFVIVALIVLAVLGSIASVTRRVWPSTDLTNRRRQP